ncbi:MAG: DUF2690 domain-containing protein [Actinophytocola sp.]|uniref:DUF2690 domain-containing protein n=1 Tax=Actinophytocola sp. TaxID=1872138 RepID=UPI00132285D2|nr:DUF2690 domain-containing protein [Actinophytocola sp.]MPZ79915.1 DUF2690 domain-containing protein [Actinophytocola sp.]
MKVPEPRPELSEPLRHWVEQFHAVVTATGYRAQTELAKALHLGRSTLNRYLTGERVPEKRLVETLIGMARDNGEPVDERVVLHAHAVASAPARRRPDARDGETEPPDAALEPAAGRRVTRRRVAIAAGAALVVALAVGGMLVIGGPRAAGCTARSCHGKNHHEQGCDDRPQVLATGPRLTDGTVVKILYSATCAAAWARTVSSRPGAVVELTDGDGGSQQARLGKVDGEASPVPTRMLPAAPGTRLRGCVTAGGESACTDEIEVPS